jgi:primase-polymerase (primpol)-like protein
MNNYDNIPVEIRAKPNWVGFRVTPKADGSGWNKMPVNVKTGKAASSRDASTWTDFATAVAAVKNKRYGIKDIGYAFDSDGIIGIDVDHCVGADGELNAMAKDVLGAVLSYTEYSVSGGGLHIIARCGWEFESGKRGDFEVYRTGRFFVFTGNVLDGRPTEILDCTEAIKPVYAKYMTHKANGQSGDLQRTPTAPSLSGQARSIPQTALNGTPSGVQSADGKDCDRENTAAVTRPVATVSEREKVKTVADMSDAELLDKAFNSRSGDDFRRLYEGDISGYASASEADLAFCNRTAFWTAKDAARIDSIFRSSRLFRPKWDERHGSMTYGQKTIETAIAGCREVYKPPREKTERRKRKPSFTGSEGIAEENGELYLIGQNGNKKRLTNFTVRVECELVTDDECIYSLALKNSEKEERVQFKTLDMVSAQAFKKKLNEKSMGWLFWATDRELELIKEYLGTMPCVKKRGYKGIGMLKVPTEDKPHRYVYAGEKFSIDACGATVDDVVSIATDRHIRATPEDNDTMTQYELLNIGRLLMAYNETAKTASVLCYMAACYGKSKLNARGVKFPHLVIVGEAGGGKSFTTDNVIKPFFSATKSQQVSEMTQFTLLKALSSSNCVPLILEEYKPSTVNERQINNLHNSLRGAYDGLEGERGNPDQSSKSYVLTAPIVLIGEESPREPAIKERSIELLFSKMDIENRIEYGAAIEKNTGAIKNLGMEVLLEALRATESDLRTAYTNALCIIDKRIPPRSAGCIAAVAVGQYLLERVANRYGTDFKTAFGLTREEVISEVTAAVKRWTLGGNHNKSVVDKTFETFNRMSEVIKAELHYTGKDVERDKKKIKGIAIDIVRIYDKFTKYAREHALKQEILDVDTFCAQLEKKDYFIEKNHSGWFLKEGEFGSGAKKHTVKCYLLDAAKLAAKCEVETLLENCGITLDAHTEFTAVQEELPF